MLKSPTMEEALRPLKVLAIKAREAFNLAIAEHEVRVATSKARSRDNERRATEELKKDQRADVSSYFKTESTAEEPTLKRYIATNASTEALGVLLQQNDNGLLVHRDEMLSLLDRLDEEGHADERGLYLYGLERKFCLHFRPHRPGPGYAHRSGLHLDAWWHATGTHIPVHRDG